MSKGSRLASMARASIGVVGVALMLAMSCTANITEWNVGNDKGWTFGVAGWEKGKHFRIDDYLVFKYDPKVHNVVSVEEDEYKSCRASEDSKRKYTYNSGNDKIPLVGNKFHFICSIPGHCERGMKIVLRASG